MREKTWQRLEIGDKVYDIGHKVRGTVYGFIASMSGERIAMIHATHDWTGKPLGERGFDCFVSYNTIKLEGELSA